MLPGRTDSDNPAWIPLAVALAVLGFVVLGCLWIDLPGLQYDEALFVAASYPDPSRGGAGYVEILGQPVCIMILPYLGALKGWLYRLVAEVAPASAAAVRAPAVFLGAFTLVVLFWFARRVFDARTALIAVALAASDPTFLFTTRLDWGPVVIQRLCWLGGCWLLLRWHEHPSPGWLFPASLLFGLGVFDKLTFLWLLAALVVAALTVFPRELLGSIKTKPAAIAAAGMLVGCLPFLLYRFTTAPRSLGLRWETSLQPVFAKLSMLQHALDGTIFQGWMAHVTAPQAALPDGLLARWVCWWTGDRLIAATWMPWALGAAVLLLPLTLRTPLRRGLLFVGVFCAIAIGLMLPVESGGSVHHLALIYPFPQLFVAASFSAVAAGMFGATRPGRGRILMAGVASLLVLTNVRAVTEQYGQILQYGGTPSWSEAIYELHDAVEAQDPKKVVVLDWGLAMQLRLLSRDTLPLKEAPQPASEERYFVETIEQAMAAPGTIFIGYEPSVPTVNPRTRELLERVAGEGGRELRRVAQVSDRQMRPRYEILTAE
ncbi:MAG: glycosyltransferase family 39 protein [Bryobacterales bacterium]